MSQKAPLPEPLASGKRLVDEGRREEALPHLWIALEEARARDDGCSLARILALAQEIRDGGRDRAGAEAVAASARESLFTDVGGEAENRQDDPYAPQGRGATIRLLAGMLAAAVVGAAAGAAIGAAIGAGAERILPEDQFGPEIELAPAGEGSQGRRPIADAGLFVVPLDGTPRPLLVRVARGVEQKIGVPARVLARVRSEEPSFNPKRRQIEGNALIAQLWHAYPTGNPSAAVIGVTNGDLYWSGAERDRFAFGVVADSRYAVISTARMDPTSFGAPPNPVLLEERLRKIVTRYVGELYFRLERTSNEESVMRSSIRGLADLDEMSDEFCPARPGEIASC